MENGELFVLSEQDEFEAWARKQNLSMEQHPMFYIFLSRDTDDARKAWRETVNSGTASTHPASLAALDYLKRKAAEQ